MNETSTKTFNANVNKTATKEPAISMLIDADDMMFYHAIRPDLDLLQKVPQQKIIEGIINFSRNAR